MGLNYKNAGVDIEAANKTKKKMVAFVKETFTPQVISNIGGFGGLFSLKEIKNYNEPILVSSVDGVGTKLKVAVLMNKHNTVGIDIVSHCVDDILVQGAKPLFFMDYIATGTHCEQVILDVVAGLAEGCKIAGCVVLSLFSS